MILSVDPGDTTGLVTWSESGRELIRADVPLENLPKTFIDFDSELSTIVYEDFRLFAHKAVQQTGSKFGASQAIGMLKYLAFQTGAKMVAQKPDILRIAAMHAGVKIPRQGHITDSLSAYLHGFYYFENQGILGAVARDWS